MNIRILESARIDLKRGYHFYEKQEQGLGNYFLNSLYSDIDSLIIYSGIHPVKFDEYFCLLSKRFPFAIYYRIENKDVFIEAILDCRQRPENIEKRFGNK
ncbi:hypothetical protein BH23BAC3_BH23BAC3_14900 [soil metagenome]